MDHHGEEWRTIPSLPEYEASTLGRVRRKPWIAPMPRGGFRAYGGKPWFGAWDEEHRRFVFMFRRKTYRVAPVVCEAFNGPAPAGQICLHGDEDSRNNRPDNLSWGTHKENSNAPKFLDYCRSRRRAAPGNQSSWM